jgi:predicted nuclease of predicted toxin-antitoxin system
MKLLLDENITGYKEHFELLGWDVATVHQMKMDGEADIEIVKIAKKDGLFILTKDKKMKEKCDLAQVGCFLISDQWLIKKIDEEIKAFI